MALQTERPGSVRSNWVSPRRLLPAAFVGQALASLAAWVLVNDESQEGAWSNTDFGQWVELSLVCVALAGVASGIATRRWGVAVAVVAGCALAVASGCALFVGYAVLNSA